MPANYQHEIEAYKKLFKNFDNLFHELNKIFRYSIKFLTTVFPAPAPDDAAFLIYDFICCFS